ncbi:GNAT family N-acetyltransferase [Vibrio ostreicida]|uniref:GNAT family N-acetyltransferase n=1 Tax=Vibrio ostreicida TaxID=526588 RepID=A0ABT8BQ98_9VIBR|nr:GNAT family N-acetyltransferase [Vibrio ostreicida]MDN3608908.1 GNAT family N-acetyltransferase [Vibrio ostreicida]NPD09942.1 GNAT family N-acetyltransferase [Vibrio ostreicida]
MLSWQLLPFKDLSPTQLYQLLKLRVDVFVVEQSCPYPELDDKDPLPEVYHLLGYKDNELIACARLLPPGVSYPSASIGRVATKQEHRGDGLGHQLLTQALTRCEQLWPDIDIEIGAQQHLAAFYQHHGFQPTSAMYLEDNIPHIDMILKR